jgi:Icc-related predicted phosphoesterase
MRVLACAHLNGELDRLRDLERAVDAERPELLVFAGNMLAPGRAAEKGAPRALHQVLHALAELPCHVAVVPGEQDAPERRVLPIETAGEWTERHLHCVHGMHLPMGELAVAGFGGRVTEHERDNEASLRYPGWEVRYRMAFLSQVDQALLLLVFHHPPAQVRDLDLLDGDGAGSEVVTELIGTWNPRVAVVAGARPGQGLYAKTVVVSPGQLDRGEYAVFDARGGRDVRFADGASATRTQG